MFCIRCHLDPCVCPMAMPTTLEQAHSVARVVGILGDEIARLRQEVAALGDVAHAHKRAAETALEECARLRGVIVEARERFAEGRLDEVWHMLEAADSDGE